MEVRWGVKTHPQEEKNPEENKNTNEAEVIKYDQCWYNRNL